MQEKLELLADRVRALIQEVNDLRAQNEQLQALLTQKENEAGLTKAETQEAIERLDALIRSIEKAQQTVNDDQTMNF
jgi:cell division septum initiation protein DivIVA